MTTPPAAVNRFRPITILLAMIVAVLGLVVGCGGGAGSGAGGGSGSAAAPTAPGEPTSSNTPSLNTIVIKNFSYTPASLTVAPGTKITVVNEDQAPHTVTTKDKSVDSGTIEGGQRGEITAPSKPGTYPYICTIHQYMTGTLIVK